MTTILCPMCGRTKNRLGCRIVFWLGARTWICGQCYSKHKNTDNYRVELPFLTNEEVDALYDKFMSIQGDAFTHRVMRELLEDESDEISREYDHITDALKYGTGAKKVTIPLSVFEIAKRLQDQTR